jgi:hypothetical protein
MTEIFISHSTMEKVLANYLADWLQSNFHGVDCFCTSRPPDIPPGTEWFDHIRERARSSGLCLSLLSPDSCASAWIQFESGLVAGAGSEKILVPTLYGGIIDSMIPRTMHAFQYLHLTRPATMEAFLSEHLLGGTPLTQGQEYVDFVREMPPDVERLMSFGELGLLSSGVIETTRQGRTTLSPDSSSVDFPRRVGQRCLVAVRARLVPRRVRYINHWKCGFTLVRKDVRQPHGHFQFHAGCHHGISSWSVYPTEDHHPPMNIPAKLHLEEACEIQIWLTSDGLFAACVGIDSDSERTLIRSDTGENIWRLRSDAWDAFRLEAWADDAPFQIDVDALEIDMAGPEVSAA